MEARHLHRQDSIPTWVTDEISKFQRYSPHPQTIRTVLEFSKEITVDKARSSVEFLLHELPVRLAVTIKLIDSLPLECRSTEGVGLVRDWYVQSFTDLLHYRRSTHNNTRLSVSDIQWFTNVSKRILNRHDLTVQNLALGIHSARSTTRSGADMRHILDELYLSRIGTRLLLGQQIALFDGISDATNLDAYSKKHGTGVVEEGVNVKQVVHDAARAARNVCMNRYCDAPEIRIQRPKEYVPKPSAPFEYVPSHLYLICFELLKNSMRAVVETHQDHSVHLPPIDVTIAKGEGDVTLRISDEGGGLRREDIPHLFEYGFTTATDVKEHTVDHGKQVPLAGLGYGLPLARLYARYLGGDMRLISMERWGTDAWVWLRASGEENEEHLKIPRAMQ